MSNIKITVSTPSDGGSSTITAIIEKALIDNGFSNITVNDRDGYETYKKVRDSLNKAEMVKSVVNKTKSIDINQIPQVKSFKFSK